MTRQSEDLALEEWESRGDLKPCPCCPSGGEPTLMLNGSIQCLECGLFQHSGAVPWNTRPSPWCSVADRLPEVGIEGYLTHGGECIEPWRVCFMDKTGWRVLDDFEDSAPGVTHWMPLPLPPEEKQ
jgi:hypothetical protein